MIHTGPTPLPLLASHLLAGAGMPRRRDPPIERTGVEGLRCCVPCVATPATRRLSYARSKVTGMDDELVRVSDAISALAGRGVGPAAVAVLTARLETVHRSVRQLHAVELALVRGADRAGLPVRAGATSTTVSLTHRLQVTPSTARRTVETRPPPTRNPYHRRQ